MITITDDSNYIRVRRDGDIILSGPQQAIDSSIVIAAGVNLTFTEAYAALNLLITEYPDLTSQCASALRDLGLKEAALTDASDDEEEYNDCYSCGEGCPRHECPKSKVPCGHHCNCSWVHDKCHWCGAEFGEDGEEEGGTEATPSPKIPTAAEVLARHALEARDEAGDRRITTLEAENAALRQRIAEMEGASAGRVHRPTIDPDVCRYIEHSLLGDDDVSVNTLRAMIDVYDFDADIQRLYRALDDLEADRWEGTAPYEEDDGGAA